MERISVAEAERDLSKLIDRVRTEGVSFELESGSTVVARLTPAKVTSKLKVRDLNAALASLPKLGDDSEAFSRDLEAIRREYPMEKNPWD